MPSWAFFTTEEEADANAGIFTNSGAEEEMPQTANKQITTARSACSPVSHNMSQRFSSEGPR